MDEIGDKMKLIKMRMNVTDMTLNEDKIKHIRSLIQKSGVRELELYNDGLISKAHDHFCKFRENISEITQIKGLKYNIKWDEIQLNS